MNAMFKSGIGWATIFFVMILVGLPWACRALVWTLETLNQLG